MSIVGSLAPTMHIQRHWKGFGAGDFNSRYGSFDNPLGEEAFWKNDRDFNMQFPFLISEKLDDWGYGRLDEDDPFGDLIDFNFIDGAASGHGSRLTSLANKFLAKSIEGQTPDPDAPWYNLGFTSLFPEEGALGRTPPTPTQYVFSQRGSFGKGSAHVNKGGLSYDISAFSYGQNSHSGTGLGSGGVAYSLAALIGRSGSPFWTSFNAYDTSDDIDYRSLSYKEHQPKYSYMTAFRPVDAFNDQTGKNKDGTDFGSRGAHRNAGLDTKFYSPLIQYSWRFIAIDSVADAKFKGGETSWRGNEQKLKYAKKLYKDQSFTSDPKAAASDPSSTLIKQYSLMVYGDLGTKYGDRPGGLAHAEKESLTK